MRFKQHAFVLGVIEELRRQGSWTGKTHVQKALSLLRDSRQADVPFRFVLYKYGPYSFEVEAAIEEMRSYGAIQAVPNSQGYGVALAPERMADYARRQEPLTEPEMEAINRVCRFVGTKNVTELERLATASWIQRQEGIAEPGQVAKRLNALKPHISIADATVANETVSSWLCED